MACRPAPSVSRRSRPARRTGRPGATRLSSSRCRGDLAGAGVPDRAQAVRHAWCEGPRHRSTPTAWRRLLPTFCSPRPAAPSQTPLSSRRRRDRAPRNLRVAAPALRLPPVLSAPAVIPTQSAWTIPAFATPALAPACTVGAAPSTVPAKSHFETEPGLGEQGAVAAGVGGARSSHCRDDTWACRALAANGRDGIRACGALAASGRLTSGWGD